jgi:periplasmic protein TonB
MFNNLVESVSDVRRSAKQSTFFGVTAVINIALLAAVFVWSLYSFDLTAFGQNDDLAVNTLVTPVQMPEKLPVPVSAAKPTQIIDSSKGIGKIEVIKDPVEDINNSTSVPKDTSVGCNPANTVRPNVPYIVGSTTERTIGQDYPEQRSVGNKPGIALKTSADGNNEKELVAPPVAKPQPAPEAKKVTNVSKGVINGLAVVLPKPAYPPMAKTGRIAGAVNVQVMIDEEGRVVSASAVSGHPLLRAAAVQAARQAKFTPTQLSNQPVKVTGVIIYNFVPQ